MKWLKRMFFEEEPKNEMLEHFREINDSLNEIGLTTYTEEGEDMRKVMAVEILSRKYPFIKNYQKDMFLKGADDKTLKLIEKEAQRRLLAGKK